MTKRIIYLLIIVQINLSFGQNLKINLSTDNYLEIDRAKNDLYFVQKNESIYIKEYYPFLAPLTSSKYEPKGLKIYPNDTFLAFNKSNNQLGLLHIKQNFIPFPSNTFIKRANLELNSGQNDETYDYHILILDSDNSKKYGAINKISGKYLEPKFDFIDYKNTLNDFLIVGSKKNNEMFYGIFTNNGKEKIPCTYKKITATKDKTYILQDSVNTIVFLNIELTVIKKIDALQDINGYKNYFAFKQNNKWGVFDNSGNINIKPIYDQMEILNIDNTDFAIFEEENSGKYNLYNLNQRKDILQFCEFIKFIDSEPSLIFTGIKENRYLYDLTGIKIATLDRSTNVKTYKGLNPKFIFFTGKEKLWGIIDTKGKIIQKPRWDEAIDVMSSTLKCPFIKFKFKNIEEYVDSSGIISKNSPCNNNTVAPELK